MEPIKLYLSAVLQEIDNSVLSKYAPSTITCCERSDRYDLNHISAESVIPNDVLSLCSKILWSTVSNAALKSSQ